MASSDLSLSLPDGRTVPLKLKTHGAAKRLKLKIPHTGWEVRMTLPRGVTEQQALRFAQDKIDWITANLPTEGPRGPLTDGSSFPYRGHVLQLRHDDEAPRAGCLEGSLFAVSGDSAGLEGRVLRWLKKQAREELSAKAAYYAGKLGVTVKGVTLKDTKSRWGSCSSTGRLNFSWRLIMAPPFVLDYVVAHEVAHLRHLDHSDAFWATVQKIHGPYSPPEQWLKLQGAGLHRVFVG